MSEHDYRPFLIRMHLPEGTEIEYVVNGVEDVRTAAVMVLERVDSTALAVRRRFDPATGVEDHFVPDDYRAVAEITDGLVSSLPRRMPVPKETENDFDKAAVAAAEKYADAIGESRDFATAMPALMRGLIDLSYEDGVEMSELIVDLGNDRIEHGRDETPRLLGAYFKSLSADLGGDVEQAREAVDFYVSESGIEGAEDPYVGMYHLVYGLIESSEHRNIDFTHTIASILEAAEHDPAPTVHPRV